MTEFEEWYREESARCQPPAVYDLKRELIEYCGSDVKLLKAGCQKFVAEFRTVAGFDPLEKCVTITQACNRYWCKRVMEEDSIALEPCSGWHGARPPNSLKSLEWLLWEERRRGTRIRHARNGGEVALRLAVHTYHVDGYHQESRTCFEFQGCLRHGCRTCFPDRKQVPHCTMDLNEEALRRQTVQKLKAFRDAGYTVVEMWECEFSDLKKQVGECRDFVSGLHLVEPLELREAFFGGRTGAVSLYHRVTGDEQIRYVDVTSEYPWVNKNGVYPVGHPVILY